MIAFADDGLEIPFFIEKYGEIIKVNAAFLVLSGFSSEELLGLSVTKVWKELLRIMPSPSDVDGDIFMFTKLLEARCVAIKVLGQQSTGETTYQFSEIPNSRFEDKNQFVEKLISEDNKGVGIYTSPDFILIKANQTYLNHLPKPYNTKELIYGKCLKDFIPGFEGSHGDKIWKNVVCTNKSYYSREKRRKLLKDDSKYWDNSVTPIAENGQVKYIVSILDDVTDRVLSREHISNQAETIRKQKEELDAILNSMSDAIYIVDKNKDFILINAEARKKVFGNNIVNDFNTLYQSVKAFDMDGKEIPFDMLPTVRALRGEIVKNCRLKVHANDVEWIADVNTTPIYDGNHSLSMVALCLRDITQQVKLQNDKDDALELSMKLKDEFLYLMTHEFKTPITVINSALQTINTVCKSDVTDRLHRFLDIINQNTNRQLRLVNNLLDITRINSGHLKLNLCNIDIVYITRAIVNSVALYADQKNIKLNFITELSEKIVSLDEEKYERILLNLLSNALKFTPYGGTIDVSLSIKKQKNKNMICLSVKDEGIGIPQDKQEQIFQRFGQVDGSLSRQAEGTGLGLYLVKMLVSSFGGVIRVESEEDKGSTFTALVPAITAAAYNNNKVFSEVNTRIIKTIAIEFSDIYF